MQRRLTLGVAALAIAAAAFAVYSGSLRNGFVWDDHIYVEGNPFVADPGNYRTLLSRRFWTSADAGVADAARPVFLASLLADRALWGDKPSGYHLTNVLLHAADSVLVFALSLSVLPGPQAAAAALLFAVHPANSEAVELPSFRPDLLAAFFVLCALLLHRRWRRDRGGQASPAGILGCAGLYALGLLSKEMAITFPALALALEATVWRGKSKADRRLRSLAPALIVYGLVACGYLAWRGPRAGYAALVTPKAVAPAAPAAQPSTPQPPPQDARLKAAEKPKPAQSKFQTFPPSKPQWSRVYEHRVTKALTACGVLGQEAALLALGGPLRVDRAPVVIESVLSPRVWGLLLLLALAVLAAARAWRRGQRLPALALAWVLLAWLPVSNVIAIYNPIAERYLYLLSIGACWAFAWAAFALAQRLPKTAAPWAAGALTAALAAAFGLRVFERSKDWRSDETLFNRAAAGGADNARVFYNLGYEAQGGGNPASAESYYRKALSLNPRYVEAQTNLAALFCAQDKVGECETLLRQVVAEKPSSHLPFLALAQALTRRKKYREALDFYRKAYDLSKHRDANAALFLARGCLDAGEDLEEGLAAVRDALSLQPLDQTGEELFALLSEALGRRDIAASHAPAAAAGGKQIWPPDAGAYVALGRLLEDNGKRNGAILAYRAATDLDPKAVAPRLELARVSTQEWEPRAMYESVLKLEPKNHEANYRLGMRLMDAGGFGEAIPLLKTAADSDPKDAYAAMNLGVCYHHAGRQPEAEAALEQALARGGTAPAFYYNLGVVYADDPKRLEDAAKMLKRAVEIADDYTDAWYNLGVVMLKLGRKDQALRDFQKTIHLAGKKIEALNNAAALLIEKSQFAPAEKLLRQALDVSPTNTSLHNNLGEALLGQRKFEEASREFETAIERTPVTEPGAASDRARYLRNLAQAYAGMGKRDLAIDAYRQAQALVGSP